MTLRARFAMAASVAVACSITLLAVLVYVAERTELLRVADTDLYREAALVSASLPEGAAPTATVIDQNAIRHYELRGQLVSEDGQITRLQPGAVLPTNETMLDVAAGTGNRFISDATLEGASYRVLTVPAPDGALVLGRSMADVEGHLRDFMGALLVLLLGGFALAVILGRVVARTSMGPIVRLTAAAERLVEERAFRHRLEVRGDDELARLAATVNRLLDSVWDARRSQSQLVADASHELRTPLTTIWTNLEVMSDARSLGVEDREHLMNELRTEVAGLMGATDDLLELARDESAPLVLDEVALDDLLRDAVATARSRWPRITFDFSATEVTVTGDRAQLYRAVLNVLDNAAKWSPQGGRVDVHLDDDQLTVRDHGPGIPPAEMDRLFERFYRSTTARGLPGAGLGLAIVRKVVEDHGWQVTARNAPGGGALFRIELRPQVQADLTSAGIEREEAPRSRWTALRPVVPWAAAAALVAAPLAATAILTLDGRLPTSTGAVPLVALTGTLDRCGGQYCVEGSVVDFGPTWYVRDTRTPHDYDHDGTLSRLEVEIGGMLGTVIRLETDGGELDQDVFTINGMPFRDVHGQLPEPPIS